MQVIRPVYFPRQARQVSGKRLHYTLGYLALVLTIIGSFLLIPSQIKFTADDDLTIASFAAIGIYCLVALYLTSYQQPFSMNCSHWIFILFFMAYAPLVQFLTQNFPGQADIGMFDPLHLEVNVLILLWCVCYSVVYKYAFALKPNLTHPILDTHDRQKPNYLWMTLFGLACAAFAVKTIGIDSLLSRAAGSDNSSGVGSPLLLISSTLGRVCPLAILVIILLTGRRKQNAYYLALVIAVGCALITNFPLSLARFASGTLIVGLVCTFLRYRRMTSLWLLILFWLGFVVAMPFLNLFRYNTVQDASVASYQQQDIASVVTGGDFDAYMMMIATVSYGQKSGNITMGRQLAGGLLFFVPRAMWPDKPEASGGIAVQNTILSFYNLSEPLPAEGYINFGVAGVVLFAIGFGWIVARLDRNYWARIENARRARPTILIMMYPFLVGSVIILMRGSFLTSFAYTVGPIAAYWVALKIAYIDSEIRPNSRILKRLRDGGSLQQRTSFSSRSS